MELLGDWDKKKKKKSEIRISESGFRSVCWETCKIQVEDKRFGRRSGVMSNE